MTPALKIRGIYATALTGFFLGKGIAITFPSEETAARFPGVEQGKFPERADAEISDLEGKQGVLVQGDPDACFLTSELIKKSFLDAVFRKGMTPWASEIEFPGLTKSALDEERNRIVPTVLNHHRLKTIASESVDLVEKKDLAHHPEKRNSVSVELEKRLIWDCYSPGKEMAIEHVKLDGEIVYLSEGELVEADFKERRLVLKRRKFKGRSRYDGLNVEKREGDFALTEAREGDWFYKHTYLRGDGEVIGWYFNVNTPVEFYPGRIRYVDLEVDVVARPGGKVKVIDEIILARHLRSGRLSERLQEKATRVAAGLRSMLLDRSRFRDQRG